MSNEQVVRDACRVIWTDGDTSRIREFYAEDYRADYPFGDGWGAGPDGAKAYADAIRAGFPDYRETIEDIVVEGDKVCFPCINNNLVNNIIDGGLTLRL